MPRPQVGSRVFVITSKLNKQSPYAGFLRDNATNLEAPVPKMTPARIVNHLGVGPGEPRAETYVHAEVRTRVFTDALEPADPMTDEELEEALRNLAQERSAEEFLEVVQRVIKA